MRGITKRFGNLLANDDVSMDVAAGRIVGLLGENGAGKSTLMNVLAGIYMPDRGEVTIDGKPLSLGSPAHSVAAGIGMVHQQFKLVETLTGYENCMLGRRRRPIGRGELRALMDGLGFEIDLSAPVWRMTIAVRQQLEILRTLVMGARVLVLDEPTSVLSPQESRRVFALVRKVAHSGRAVILISHKLAEILEVADDLVVMRGGAVVHEGPAQGLAPAALARLIVGDREIREGARPTWSPGEALLRLQDVEVENELGSIVVAGASLTVRAGEVVALVGVTGNGQSELIEAIGGLRQVRKGMIERPDRSGRRGFAFIPSRHLGVALAPNLSVAENGILGHQRDRPFRWWLSRAAMAERARAVTARFGVSADPGSAVRRLSGGNLQRVVLGRELGSDPPLIVADYPTRGLDVASAAQIRAALVASAQAGAAVLLSSEELEESLQIANRVLVMSRGRIVADLPAATVDPDNLAQLMTGGGHGAAAAAA